MDAKLVISASLLIILAITPLGSGIQCHVCHSNEDARCKDSFYEDEVSWRPKTLEFLVECPDDFCLKYKHADQTVNRACGDSMEKNDEDSCYKKDDGTIVCQCFGDGCNSASLFSVSSLAVFSTLVVAYLMQ